MNTGPSPQTKDQAEQSHSISMHLVALPSSKLKPLRTARRNPHLRSVWEIKSGGHDADDHVVTIVFTPPTGPADRNNVVIVTTDCGAIETQRQTCQARSDVGTATCVQVNGVGDPTGLAVVVKNLERRLQVRIPDTDALVGAMDDDRTYTGPATIAVTDTDDPLPCALASNPCARPTATSFSP